MEHDGIISCVAVTDNNMHIVSGSYDKTLLIWGLCTGAVEHKLIGHTSHVTAVRLSSDGKLALSGMYVIEYLCYSK